MSQDKHGGPVLSEALQAKAIELSVRLDREVKRTMRCAKYGHWHNWIVYDGEFHIQQEVPIPEWVYTPGEEVERPCYRATCGLEDQHSGPHDKGRKPDWVVRAEGAEARPLSDWNV